MPELQQILCAIQPVGLSLEQKKAFFAISSCRTELLGSHADHCDSCGHTRISYNSCRNRHCPKCQGSKQQEWVEAQLGKLLPVSYFHVVFTLPQELNSIVLQNQNILYSILMKSAGDTLIELAKNPKISWCPNRGHGSFAYLGAESCFPSPCPLPSARWWSCRGRPELYSF